MKIYSITLNNETTFQVNDTLSHTIKLANYLADNNPEMIVEISIEWTITDKDNKNGYYRSN